MNEYSQYLQNAQKLSTENKLAVRASENRIFIIIDGGSLIINKTDCLIRVREFNPRSSSQYPLLRSMVFNEYEDIIPYLDLINNPDKLFQYSLICDITLDNLLFIQMLYYNAYPEDKQ